MKTRKRIVALALCLCALCVLPACDDDPTSPPFTFDPVLAELWPHQDGTAWTYQLTQALCPATEPGFYENVEDVPPLPSIDALVADLRCALACEPEAVVTGTHHLSFDGTVEITPEITAQRLRGLVVPGTGYPDVPMPLEEASWRLEAARIAGYSPYVGEDPVWIYLADGLQPGAEFSLQILPGVSSDVILHGRITRHLELDVDGAVVPCVECFYLLDMGVVTMVDEGGGTLGHAHPYRYGVVVYGRGVGPIRCLERRVEIRDGVLQDPGGSAVTEIRAELTTSG